LHYVIYISLADEFAAKELSESKFQLALTERSIENVKRDKDEKLHLEQVLGSDLKVEIQRKADQEQERRELQNRLMDVNTQIAQWEIRQKALADEHKRDKIEIEERRKVFLSEQVFPYRILYSKSYTVETATQRV
jgi:hypothetical protein